MAPGTVLFDAVYDPWPTPLAAAAAAAGCHIVSGLDLLLAQAVRQFELFTGVDAPVAAMRSALYAAGGRRRQLLVNCRYLRRNSNVSLKLSLARGSDAG